MTILYRPAKLHGNADALFRIDTRHCHDHGHLIKKIKYPSEMKSILLMLVNAWYRDLKHQNVKSW